MLWERVREGRRNEAGKDKKREHYRRPWKEKKRKRDKGIKLKMQKLLVLWGRVREERRNEEGKDKKGESYRRS